MMCMQFAVVHTNMV